MEKTTQRITITLPIEVYNKIKESAVRDVRTIGEEITYLLQLHVPSYAPQTFHTPTSSTNVNTNTNTNIGYRRTIIN